MNNKKSLNDTLKELYKTDRKKYSVYMSCIVVAILAFAVLWGVMFYAIANTSSCEHE